MDLFIALGALVVLAMLFGGGKKLRPNECPHCHRDSLETKTRFFGGPYRRCKHTWRCGYDERAEESRALAVEQNHEGSLADNAARINYDRAKDGRPLI